MDKVRSEQLRKLYLSVPSLSSCRAPWVHTQRQRLFRGALISAAPGLSTAAPAALNALTRWTLRGQHAPLSSAPADRKPYFISPIENQQKSKKKKIVCYFLYNLKMSKVVVIQLFPLNLKSEVLLTLVKWAIIVVWGSFKADCISKCLTSIKFFSLQHWTLVWATLSSMEAPCGFNLGQMSLYWIIWLPWTPHQSLHLS